MAKALSVDLRKRVIAAVKEGASCRQAAARFGVSASSAIRWRALSKVAGDATPKQQHPGCRAEQPDDHRPGCDAGVALLVGSKSKIGQGHGIEWGGGTGALAAAPPTIAYVSAIDETRRRLWSGEKIDYVHADGGAYPFFTYAATGVASMADGDLFRALLRRKRGHDVPQHRSGLALDELRLHALHDDGRPWLAVRPSRAPARRTRRGPVDQPQCALAYLLSMGRA